jgi:predicted esterase
VSAVAAERPDPAGTATLDPAQLAALDAPARLAAALAAGGNLPNAQRLLRLAGYPVSITAGKNDARVDDSGLFAAHAVNVLDAGWSYSARDTLGHEEC